MTTLTQWIDRSLADQVIFDVPSLDDPRTRHADFMREIQSALPEGKNDLAELDIDTCVGRACVAAITRYADLYLHVDSHSHVVVPLIRSLIATMNIWLHG